MSNDSSDKISLTRRQAVAALGGGVLLASGAAAVTGIETTKWSQDDAAQQAADLQFQLNELTKQNQALAQQLTAAQLQVDLYKGLGGLHDTLDNIGIDSIISAAMSAYKGSLDALARGVNALREGIVAAEGALDNFEVAFATVRGALNTAEVAWANVNALLKNVQDLVAGATSPILPLVDQATKFFNDLLGKIPFGAGEPARKTLQGITGLIVAIPSALDDLSDGLFRTLREDWFSDDSAHNIETTLAQPIVNGVLQPARHFLDQVEVTLTNWETQVAKPVNSALAQREIVQKQIAAYKATHKLA